MTIRAYTPYLASIVFLCGTALAQNPAGSQQPTNPQPGGAPSSPGMTPSTYPGSGPTDSTPDGGSVISDKAFVKKATEETVTEVELAKLAQEKASNEAVKEFSKRIVDDHTKTNQNLEAAAAKVKVDVPSDLPRGGKKSKEKLAKLSGPDFDRAYTKLMLNSQKDNEESFTQEARLGKIPEVKEFAMKALPTVQEHRKMAEELQASIKK